MPFSIGDFLVKCKYMEDQKAQIEPSADVQGDNVQNIQSAHNQPEENQTEGRKRSLANLQKPGEPSNNPKGRPRGVLNFQTRLNMAIDRLAEEFVKQHNAKRKKSISEGVDASKLPPEITVEDVDIMGDVFAKYVNAARNGDLKTAKDLMDRAYGRAIQKVEVGGIEGNPLIEAKIKAAEAEADAWERSWIDAPEPEPVAETQEHASPSTNTGTAE